MIFTISGNYWQHQEYPSDIATQSEHYISSGARQLVKAELDYDDGMLIYEIDIRTAEGYKYEVKVDANTGAISRVKLD